MQSNIDDFFIPDNEVKLPEELDYSRAVEYIRSGEAFSRSTYQSVYIIDYYKRNIKNRNLINMKSKILYLLTICLCGCMSMFGQTEKAKVIKPLESYSFEYRIISNLADSTLNGWEISLTNDSDWITEDFGVIENGIIDIKGESKRSFPATLRIQNSNPENKKKFKINLIIEPGTILVDVNNNIPLSGGELNKGMMEWINRMNQTENYQDAWNINQEIIKKNIGNGLGELVLLNYGMQCSPYEWIETISLFDEDTRNLTAIDNITGKMDRLLPVWEGQPFKDITGKDINGESINLSEYVGKGKYVVADLWASWCKPCIILAKDVLKPIYEKYKDNPNVQFIGVAIDEISNMIDINDIPWPQIIECKELLKTYVIDSIPQVIIFGPDGTILRRHFVECHISEVLDKFLKTDIGS